MKLPFPHFSSLTRSQVVKSRSLNMNSDGDRFLKDRFLKSEDGEDIGHGIEEGQVVNSSHEGQKQEDGGTQTGIGSDKSRRSRRSRAHGPRRSRRPRKPTPTDEHHDHHDNETHDDNDDDARPDVHVNVCSCVPGCRNQQPVPDHFLQKPLSLIHI